MIAKPNHQPPSSSFPVSPSISSRIAWLEGDAATSHSAQVGSSSTTRKVGTMWTISGTLDQVLS